MADQPRNVSDADEDAKPQPGATETQQDTPAAQTEPDAKPQPGAKPANDAPAKMAADAPEPKPTEGPDSSEPKPTEGPKPTRGDAGADGVHHLRCAGRLRSGIVFGPGGGPGRGVPGGAGPAAWPL